MDCKNLFNEPISGQDIKTRTIDGSLPQKTRQYRLFDLMYHIASWVRSSQSQKSISIISPKLFLDNQPTRLFKTGRLVDINYVTCE